MKIIFDKIITKSDKILVKFSETYSQEYNVADVLKNGIIIDEDVCLDLNNIDITTTVFKPNQANLNDKFKALPRYTSVNLESLKTYLSGLEENTKETPYRIKVTNVPESINDLRFSSIVDKYIDVKFDNSVSNVTKSDLLEHCSYLISADVSNFTSLTNANSMFSGCENLTTVKLPVTEAITSADYMFKSCRSLQSIDTSTFTNVTSSSEMFMYCHALKTIDAAAFKNTKNANYMFENCDNLISVTNANFKSVESALSMFKNCAFRSLDNPCFTSLIDARYMFSDCSELDEIDSSTFGNVLYTDYMFFNCSNLFEIDGRPFTKVISAEGMFRDCNITISISQEEQGVTDHLYMDFDQDYLLGVPLQEEDDNNSDDAPGVYNPPQIDPSGTIEWEEV